MEYKRRYYTRISKRAKTNHVLRFNPNDTNMGLDVDKSGYVIAVDANGVAADAGVKVDTIIVNINGTDVVKPMDVRTLVAGLAQDTTITTIDADPEADCKRSYRLVGTGTPETFGLSFEGNRVTSVAAGSKAEDAGINKNSIITKIGSRKITAKMNTEEVTKALQTESTRRNSAGRPFPFHVQVTYPAKTETADPEEVDDSEEAGNAAAQLALSAIAYNWATPPEITPFTTHEYTDVKDKLEKMDKSIERNNSRVDEIAGSNAKNARDVQQQLAGAKLEIDKIQLATDRTKDIVSELKEKVDTAFGEYLREPTDSEKAAQAKDGQPTHRIPVFQTAISTLADVVVKLGKKTLPAILRPGTDHAKHPLADALQAITITIQNLATKIDNIEKKDNGIMATIMPYLKGAAGGLAAAAIAGGSARAVANVAKAAAGGAGVGAGLLKGAFNAVSGTQTTEQQIAQAKDESAAAEVELAKLRAVTVQAQLAQARKAAARAADAQATPFVPDPATGSALVVRNPINNSQRTSATVATNDFYNGINGVPRTLQDGN